LAVADDSTLNLDRWFEIVEDDLNVILIDDGTINRADDFERDDV
jgi:hypothetical protein